ncbi:MAG: alpha-L-fucosidase [Cyclobacteriaceae bacterium]
MKNLFTSGIIFLMLWGCSVEGQDKGDTLNEIKRYEPNWESLQQYETPEWFQDAKLGIFIHWGAYSVPAYGSEWYPRLMYMDTATFTAQLKLQQEGPNKIYLHHKEKFGDQKEFGYKDFIPMFKAENFDANQWISLFKKSGAKYVVPVAEHHDSFAMYDSKFTRWNSVDMGPERDVLGELFEAGRAEGLKMGASSHLAFNWAFFNKKDHFDTVDPEYADLYSKKGKALDEPVSEEFKELWWNRTTDIIDNYQPDILWFDFFFDIDDFKEYHPKIASYYYNKGLDWNAEVVLQDKNFGHDAFPPGTMTLDIERGKMSDISDEPWQTDTSVGKNSWGYVTDWISKTPNTLVDDLIDIVSKNGCMLLNVGPKPDGTIPEDQQQVLLEIGKWLEVNGDAIYGTRPWKIFGEGPTEVATGHHTEGKNKDLTAEDFRFTTKGDKLYAIALDWPESGELLIKSLATGAEHTKEVTSAKLLGSDADITWEQTEQGLRVKLPAEKTGGYAYAVELDLKN